MTRGQRPQHFSADLFYRRNPCWRLRRFYALEAAGKLDPLLAQDKLAMPKRPRSSPRRNSRHERGKDFDIKVALFRCNRVLSPTPISPRRPRH